MSSRPLPVRVASFSSGLCTDTPAGGWMSPAVTSPGPCLRRYIDTGSSCSELTHSSLTFITSSTTSSLTPGIVVNSCSTPSILMLVTAAPGMELSRVRRSELPSVYPNPGSSGSMVNRERVSLSDSSERLGRWEMSTYFLQYVGRPPYDANAFARPARRPTTGGPGGAARRSLRVQLDDQLFLHLRVDDLPHRQAVHQDLHLARDRLQPGRYRPATRLGVRDHERGELAGLLAYLDDVVLAHAVRRDVHLLAVDQHVAVADELAGHVAGLGVPGPVDHVVQPRLEDLQQRLAGLARPADGLLVVPAELLLQLAVHPAGLLLLAELEQVLRLLRAATAVLPGRERPRLERALRPVALAALQEELHLLAPATTAVGACVTCHVRVSLRPGDASADGTRCAAAA